MSPPLPVVRYEQETAGSAETHRERWAGRGGARPAAVVEPVAGDQISDAVEVPRRAATSPDGRALVVAQEDVAAQEPPCLLADGVGRERQPDGVRLQMAVPDRGRDR